MAERATDASELTPVGSPAQVPTSRARSARAASTAAANAARSAAAIGSRPDHAWSGLAPPSTHGRACALEHGDIEATQGEGHDL